MLNFWCYGWGAWQHLAWLAQEVKHLWRWVEIWMCERASPLKQLGDVIPSSRPVFACKAISWGHWFTVYFHCVETIFWKIELDVRQNIFEMDSWAASRLPKKCRSLWVAQLTICKQSTLGSHKASLGVATSEGNWQWSLIVGRGIC